MLNFLEAGTASSGSLIVSEHLLHRLVFKFGSSVTMQGLWWAEDADYSSIMAWATVLAALLRIGSSIANRVKWSIIKRTYLHSVPAAEVDTDLYSTKSTDIL